MAMELKNSIHTNKKLRSHRRREQDAFDSLSIKDRFKMKFVLFDWKRFLSNRILLVSAIVD